MSPATSTSIEVEARPPSPYRLPSSGGEDRVMRVEAGVATRLLHVEGSPVLVRAWQPAGDRVLLRAERVDPAAVTAPFPGARFRRAPPAPSSWSWRWRGCASRSGSTTTSATSTGASAATPCSGPLLRRRPYFRPSRRPWPWEALAWAVVKQLIESERAARIQRRIVGRWGLGLGRERGAPRDVPSARTIAGRAPAELESMGLALRRSIALRAAAREVAAGRCRLEDAERSDRRLLAIPDIGPWTVQCLGLHGRGDLDSLPVGDLVYMKLVGRLARLGRRATRRRSRSSTRPTPRIGVWPAP